MALTEEIVRLCEDAGASREYADELIKRLSAAPGEPCAWGRVIDGKAVTVSLTKTGANDDPLYTTPQPAAGWDEAIEAAAKWHESEAAHAKVIYSEMDRYSDDHEERAGWRSYKDKEDRHLSYAAHIRTLRREAPAPAEGKGTSVTEDQIKHMADRFLGWKLPEKFNPVC